MPSRHEGACARALAAVCLVFTVLVLPAHAADGLVTKKSAHSVADTMDRLVTILKERELVVFSRIDHAKGATRVGLTLRPTELVIFGNPKAGTRLMQSRQTVGIDLPLKALAWQDDQGQVWLAYNDPAHLAARHGIGDRDDLIGNITGALDRITNAAIE